MQQARIYLDNNATTPVLPEVVAAMQPFWSERFGNASAVHAAGRTARAAIDRAREQLAALIGAHPGELIFTGSGTESDNHALFGTLSPGEHLITTTIEHHAVLHAAEALAKQGVELTCVAPDSNGVVQPEAVRDALRPNTALISLMLANNETGVLQPVREVAAIAHAHGAKLHTDATQAVGKIPVSVRDLDCDLLCLSGHKMHAPQGVGALWVRKGLSLRPLLHGGPHERQRRAGTENVPGIVALGQAAKLAHIWLTSSTPCVPHSSRALGAKGGADEPDTGNEPTSGTGSATLTAMHRRFEAGLLHRIPDSVIHGQAVPRLPNTTSVRFPGVDAEALVIVLDLQGLAVSGGSACSSGAIEPSHVLRAMNLAEDDARSTIRISLSRLTTAEDLTHTIDLLESTMGRLRQII